MLSSRTCTCSAVDRRFSREFAEVRAHVMLPAAASARRRGPIGSRRTDSGVGSAQEALRCASACTRAAGATLLGRVAVLEPSLASALADVRPRYASHPRRTDQPIYPHAAFTHNALLRPSAAPWLRPARLARPRLHRDYAPLPHLHRDCTPAP